LPEGVYPIVEATLYLASAPKSNSAGAYFKAVKKVEEEGKVQVPQHLQDGTPTAGDARDPSAGSGQALHHGEGYVYPHEEPGHDVGQQYLPTALLGTYFYSPSEEGYEAQVKDRLARWRAAQEKALGIEQTEELPELSEAEVLDIKRRTGRCGEAP
jgi:putative ATPase